MTEIGGGFKQPIELLFHHFIFLFRNLKVKKGNGFVFAELKKKNAQCTKDPNYESVRWSLADIQLGFSELKS